MVPAVLRAGETTAEIWGPGGGLVREAATGRRRGAGRSGAGRRRGGWRAPPGPGLCLRGEMNTALTRVGPRGRRPAPPEEVEGSETGGKEPAADAAPGAQHGVPPPGDSARARGEAAVRGERPGAAGVVRGPPRVGVHRPQHRRAGTHLRRAQPRPRTWLSTARPVPAPLHSCFLKVSHARRPGLWGSPCPPPPSPSRGLVPRVLGNPRAASAGDSRLLAPESLGSPP